VIGLVRGRYDARWLPSRHNYALFRLFAWLRLRALKPDRRDVVLFVDRHQSAVETWTVCVWVLLMLICYLAATLFSTWPLPLALTAATPLALAGLNVPVVAGGLVFPPLWSAVTRSSVDRSRVNSFALMVCLALAAAWFARSASWLRFVAWQFAAVVTLNALAAVIVFLGRNAIARLEDSFGGAASGR
jgi:hypothetical protein